MWEVVSKLVRENKASVIKRKRTAKKGVTKPKSNVSRSNQIEKIRSDLKELKELKINNTKASTSNVKAIKITSKSQTKTSQAEESSKNAQESEKVVASPLGDRNVSTKESSSKTQQNEIFPSDNEDSADFEDIVENEINDAGHVENSVIIQNPTNPIQFASTPTETPPRQIRATYAGPKTINTLYQSTPVRIASAADTSPWRFNPTEVKYSENVFSRYSELEKSPIKSGDITKVAAETKSPMKKPRIPLATKPSSNNVQEIRRPKTLENDVRNGFGFFDDDDDNDDESPGSILPAVNVSSFHTKPIGNIKSPKKIGTVVTSPKKLERNVLKEKTSTKSNTRSIASCFRMPEAFNSIRRNLRLLKNAQPVPSNILNEPKPKTQSNILSHFGESKMATASKPSSSRGNKVIVNKSKVDTTRTTEVSDSETTNHYNDNDAYSLFETTWPERHEKPHRSYSKVTKRDHKRQHDYNSILTDDESEFGDTVVQKRTKRTKPKDDKLEEELKQFQEEKNSEFMDVEQFEMIMEKST